MTTSVPAVERAVRILKAFQDGREALGVTELSQQLGINKSTVHAILRTLAEHRLLEQDPSTRKYQLGPALVELGYLTSSRRDLSSIARPHLQALAQSTEGTALLGVFEDDAITIIDRAEPASELKITGDDGQRLHFSAGCFGRAFTAWMPVEQVERLIGEHGLRRFTASSITDPSAYRAELGRVRERGYAIDETEEYLEGVWAVSAPVWEFERVVAVVTVVGFTSRLTQERKLEAVQAALGAAGAISIGTGAPPVTGGRK
jgi:DNA-binding IclR family transcriptional regulator